jgi:hypothetical protein
MNENEFQIFKCLKELNQVILYCNKLEEVYYEICGFGNASFYETEKLKKRVKRLSKTIC